jgi:tetratricopeptide (TPR) repeat protein
VKQLLNGMGVFARESERDQSIAESMIELADWSQRCNQRPDASVRFYEDAFSRHPPFAEKLLAGYRLFAACAAAEAASAEGSFKLQLTEETRQDFRRKSLKWLRKDCDVLLKVRMSDSSNVLPNQYLWSLRQAEDLVYLHDPTELAKLKDEERQGWQNLWQDFARLSEGDSGGYLDEAHHFADTKQWVKAAESYAKAKQLGPLGSEPCYEYAATQLLANDSGGYQATCRSMLTDQSMRAYLVARTFTLAPKALDDLISATHVSSEELKKNENQFWSLTERGALAVRMNHADESIKLFRKSIEVESNVGAAVLNWLWLAIAYEQMGNSVEAKSWLHRATRFLDGLGDKRPTAVEFVTLDRHNWFEAHILRREAESMILSK